MSDEHTKPTARMIPRVDPDTPEPAHRGIDTDAVLSAIASLKSHVDTRLDATEKRLDEKINEQGRTIDERFRAAEESRQAQARISQQMHDRVTALELERTRPSAPPRTASGMMRLAGDVAKGTVSEADASLERSLSEVKIALSGEIESVRDEMREKFANVDAVNVAQNKELASQTTVLAAHGKELASQTTALAAQGKELASHTTTLAAQSKELGTINTALGAVNTTLAVLGAKFVDIANDVKKMAGFKHDPVFRLIIGAVVFSVCSYLLGRLGISLYSLPSAPH